MVTFREVPVSLPAVQICHKQIRLGSSHLKMSAKNQRGKMQFRVSLHTPPSRILRMLKVAYGKAIIKIAQVYEWQKCFRDGRVSVNDVPLRACARNGVRSDRRKSIQEISAYSGVSAGSVHTILHNDLNMHYHCEHLVPRMDIEHKHE
jgi:hypothetical protein